MARLPKFAAVLVLILAVAADAQTTRPVPEIERVLIVSVDGLRPDLLLRARTPNMRKLVDNGVFTFWARTIPIALTLPSHSSMVTGVSMEKHGVDWNGDQVGEQQYTAVPTLFELAKKAGYSTALVSGKSKFRALARPGTLDAQAIGRMTDAAVAKDAVEIIGEKSPRVMMVHFAGPDAAGHVHGWGAPGQIAVIEEVDSHIGDVLEALAKARLTDSTLIILTADHGGQGFGHGRSDARSLHIPWIASGPKLRSNYDLTLHADLQVETMDTFATACHFMGIALPQHTEGKPVLQIIDDGSKPAPPPRRFPATRPK